MLKAAPTVAFLACAATAAYAQEAPKPPEEVTPDRYQIVFTPDVPGDTFLLDTSSGRVWRMTHITDLKGEPDVWMYMWRVDSEAERTALYTEHGKKVAPVVAVAPANSPAASAAKPR